MDMPCEDDAARERGLTVDDMMVAELPNPPCFLCGKKEDKEDEVDQLLTFSSDPDYIHSATAICDACTLLVVEAMITEDDTFQSRPLVHLGNYTGWTPATR